MRSVSDQFNPPNRTACNGCESLDCGNSSLQGSVTVMTTATTRTGIGGDWVGGQLEALGLRTVLAIHAACSLASGLAMLRLPPSGGGSRGLEGRLASGFVVL